MHWNMYKTLTRTHTHSYLEIYICLCVCVFVCISEYECVHVFNSSRLFELVFIRSGVLGLASWIVAVMWLLVDILISTMCLIDANTFNGFCRFGQAMWNIARIATYRLSQIYPQSSLARWDRWTEWISNWLIWSSGIAMWTGESTTCSMDIFYETNS